MVSVVLIDVLIGVPSATTQPSPRATRIALQPTHTAAPTGTPGEPPRPTFQLVPTTADQPTQPQSPARQPPTQTPIYVIVTATATVEGSAPEAAPSPTSCPPPEGWVAYRVQPGDTLFGFQLGAEGQADVASIRQANCLQNNLLSIGQVIYLPPGAGEKAPKIDDAAPEPSGRRATNCPCAITIRPGWRLEQIAAAIDNTAAGFTGRDFLAATRGGVGLPEKWFLAGKPGDKPLEGFMFPGTYTIENGMTAQDFRDAVLNAFEANVSQQIGADAAARGMTMWQVLTLASIVQRESYEPEHQKLMASLIHNRMAKGMGIGTYVTLQYVIGGPGNWWPYPQAGISRLDTPYNTLRYKGYPPTPVDSPGLSAILAVVYPPQTDYLYVTSKCDGSGNFYTANYAEFQRENECQK